VGVGVDPAYSGRSAAPDVACHVSLGSKRRTFSRGGTAAGADGMHASPTRTSNAAVTSVSDGLVEYSTTQPPALTAAYLALTSEDGHGTAAAAKS